MRENTFAFLSVVDDKMRISGKVDPQLVDRTLFQSRESTGMFPRCQAGRLCMKVARFERQQYCNIAAWL